MKILVSPVVVLCLLMHGVVFANGLANVRVPPDSHTAWVSDSINQDGMDLSIKTFRSSLAVSSVLEFYRAHWHSDGDIPGYLENKLGQWSIISQLQDEHNIVIQLQAHTDGGSSGFISSAKKNHSGSPPDIDFPMPDGAERFSSTHVVENGSSVHTMTFVSKDSAPTAVDFYRSRLKRKGWVLASDTKQGNSQVMMFNRRADRCELVVSAEQPDITLIFVNRVVRNG